MCKVAEKSWQVEEMVNMEGENLSLVVVPEFNDSIICTEILDSVNTG